MPGRTKAALQPSSARPQPPPKSIKNVYPLGSGSVYLLIDKQRDPRGYWERIDISITDDVVEQGGSNGYAKYDLSVNDHKVKGTRCVLTSHYGGSFSSMGTNSVQDLHEERKWHFYGGGDKLRGCFSLEDSPAWAVAQLHFGLDGDVVHTLTVKIRRLGSSLVTDIEGPTIIDRNQLQNLAKTLSYIDKKAEDDTEGTEDSEGEN